VIGDLIRLVFLTAIFAAIIVYVVGIPTPHCAAAGVDALFLECKAIRK
jgi:hypothetical protein